MNDTDLNKLRRLLTANEPAELRNYLSVTQFGQPYQVGTTIPVIGNLERSPAGLWAPQGSGAVSAPLDFAKSYLTLSHNAHRLHAEVPQ